MRSASDSPSGLATIFGLAAPSGLAATGGGGGAGGAAAGAGGGVAGAWFEQAMAIPIVKTNIETRLAARIVDLPRQSAPAQYRQAGAWTQPSADVRAALAWTSGRTRGALDRRKTGRSTWPGRC